VSFHNAKNCFNDTKNFLQAPMSDPNSIALLNIANGLSELTETLSHEILKLQRELDSVHRDLKQAHTDIQRIKREL
jgi:hypothetical protein